MSDPVKDCRHCRFRYRGITTGFECFDELSAGIFGETRRLCVCKNYQEIVQTDIENTMKELCEKLPKRFNGADLCAVREDFGWWVGYDCKDASGILSHEEISATGKTLEEAFKKLNDYWFKSGKFKECLKPIKEEV